MKIEPIDMMNRDKMNELPSLQIGFIDTVCAPIYTAFAKLFPDELTTLLDGCLINRHIWRELADGNKQYGTLPLIKQRTYDNDRTNEEDLTLPSSTTIRPETNILIETDRIETKIVRRPTCTFSNQRKSI